MPKYLNTFLLKKKNKEEKSASAKTITLRSNGSVHSRKSSSGVEPLETVEKEGSASAGDLGNDENPNDLVEAATKIQAAFRGHLTRKSMKQPESDQGDIDDINLDDPELANAATKIQATFRGHRTRKNMDETKPDQKDAQEAPNAEEEIDIDLTDPEVHKAAVKIQATFKGHMVRKEQQVPNTEK